MFRDPQVLNSDLTALHSVTTAQGLWVSTCRRFLGLVVSYCLLHRLDYFTRVAMEPGYYLSGLFVLIVIALSFLTLKDAGKVCMYVCSAFESGDVIIIIRWRHCHVINVKNGVAGW